MSKKLIAFLLIFSACLPLKSFECRFFPDPQCFCDLFCGPHRLGIGPEFYSIERFRDTSIDSRECGWMIGERFFYERVHPWCIYYGADQYYATGTLTRITDCGTQFKTKLQDAEVEGRIGYTLAHKWFNVLFTPFFGYGNFTGTSKFLKPSFLRIKFRPTYNFISYGFMSNCFFCNGQVSLGFNVKWKSMTHATNKVTDCTEECHPFVFYQKMGERTQIQIDVPLMYYYWCCREDAFEISIVPFYRNRIYGAHENCPFDFFETKYEMWGARFMIDYVF